MRRPLARDLREARRATAFTLVELLIVVAIIALLISLAAPSYDKFLDRARSAACMGNLRQIGTAVGLYSADHDSTLPYINNPARPVYVAPEDLPEGATVTTMLEAFSPYGITEKSLRCPQDAVVNNYFSTEGTSYEWRPWIDGESLLTPKIYTRRGTIALRRASRIRIVMDTDSVHGGKQNTLFADGRVQMFQ